jgi:hypothetical protein
MPTFSSAQWTEPEGSGAAIAVDAAYLVRDDVDGTYSVSTTGPANAYVVREADGTCRLDPLATSGEPIRAFGETILFF